MRILLIQPRISQSFEHFEDSAGITIPLGIGYIAAYLKKHGYSDIFTIDDWVEKLNDRELKAIISQI
ncbi:unnamed protein product, partial [marine sediment metagenome]